MNSLSLNGKILSADEPILLATNRSYRYGDGLFETIKVVDGRIPLAAYHFERLFYGLDLLKYQHSILLTAEKLQHDILTLCMANGHEAAARVRLSVFRENGGLFETNKALQYIIETQHLDQPEYALNETGLNIGVYPEARKACDAFARLKSSSFLPYAMGALFATENKLDDCLIMNQKENIADSTIANVFIIRLGVIRTPALDEGCVAGVMRRWLIERLNVEPSYKIEVGKVCIDDLLEAEEVFLTNAIKGIRWVRQFHEKIYTNVMTRAIFNRYFQMAPDLAENTI